VWALFYFHISQKSLSTGHAIIQFNIVSNTDTACSRDVLSRFWDRQRWTRCVTRDVARIIPSMQNCSHQRSRLLLSVNNYYRKISSRDETTISFSELKQCFLFEKSYVSGSQTAFISLLIIRDKWNLILKNYYKFGICLIKRYLRINKQDYGLSIFNRIFIFLLNDSIVLHAIKLFILLY